MTIASRVAFYVGATALMGALGFVSSAIYLSVLSSCTGDAECIGTEATFLVVALALAVLGALLVTVGRS
jgi:hypothetical protein